MNKLDIELFNKIFGDKGGYFNVESDKTTPEIFTHLLTKCQGIVTDVTIKMENPPEILLNYVDNDSLNAGVAKVKDTYIIGINLGTVIVVFSIFNLMMGCKTAFPYLGETENLKCPKLENPHWLQEGNLYQFLNKNTEHPSELTDPTRLQMALILTEFAMEFLTLHELSHIIYGHVDYRLRLYNESEMDDGKVSLFQDAVEGLTAQALELDADTRAIWLSSHYMIEASKTLNENTPFNGLLQNMQQYIGTYVFAIVTLSRLQGIIKFDKNTLDRQSHPTPGMRVLHFIEILLDRIHNGLLNKFCSDELKNDALNIINYYIQQVEHTFKEISINEQIAKEGNKMYAFLADNIDHYNKILKKYEEIYVELSTYKFKNKY